MKALVLCGGIPQAELIQQLHKRGVYVILADMNENVMARQYADKFFAVSVMDVERIRNVAESEKVDFVITACADQVLLVQAQVSEILGLPCYIDFETAKAVSSKEIMKSVFVEKGIPTSKHVIMQDLDYDAIKDLKMPMIVKPVDSYSSRGVRKVLDHEELAEAFENAKEISRTHSVIVEEFVKGNEITVDVYVEDGKAHVLCISNIDKIPGNDRFVICRTKYPARISDAVKDKVEEVADNIADAFNLKNSPMLIQMIVDDENVSVVEFCARTGGGDKYRLIKQVSGFDVIDAVIKLTLNEKPHVDSFELKDCIVNEFLYGIPGTFDHLEGFEEMKDQGVIKEYFQLKAKGTQCKETCSSSDRIAYYTIQAENEEALRKADQLVNEKVKIINENGEDMLRHDLIATY